MWSMGLAVICGQSGSGESDTEIHLLSQKIHRLEEGQFFVADR